MEYWTNYDSKMNLHGYSKRDRIINQTKRKLREKALNSPSCKEVKLDGRNCNLVVDSGNHQYQKIIKSLPDEKFETGTYVDWANTRWLITKADYDDEVYVDGFMEQCNWNLSWQLPSGEIVRYWGVDLNATQYNSGETTMNGNKYTFGSAQHKIALPYNLHTIMLGTPQRVFLCRNMEKPTPFKITQNDSSSRSFGNGIVDISLLEDKFNADADRLVNVDGEDVWIADYFEPEAQKPSVSTTLSEISGSRKLYLDMMQTYTVVFKDADGNEILNPNFDWDITSDVLSELHVQIQGKTVVLYTDDDNFIGKTITLQILVDGEFSSEMVITISGFY